MSLASSIKFLSYTVSTAHPEEPTLKVLIELAKTLLKCVIGIQPMMQYYLNQAEEICKELQLPLLTEIQKIQAYLQEN